MVRLVNKDKYKLLGFAIVADAFSLAGTDALLELPVESGVAAAPTKPGPVVVSDSFSSPS